MCPPHNDQASLKQGKAASHVAKSLVFLAVSAALSGAAIASPSSGHTLNLTKYQDTGSVLQNLNETYTAGLKSDEETVAKEAEGGEIYAQGDVNIDVKAKGGTAIGTMLYARALDHSDLSKLNDKTWEFTDFGKTVSYDHTSTFEKSLTLNVHSDTGRTVGMVLAGSCCNLEGINGKWEEEDGYTDNRQPNATTKVTVNDLTVNVTKGDANKFASDGILIAGTRVGGNMELAVNGNATISADNALRTEYWVNDGVAGDGYVNAKVTVGENASLTLNGNVSGYVGDFIQNGGTVAVNTKDGKFFGGAVEVLGGKLAAKSLRLTSSTIENDADFTLFGNDDNESVLESSTLKVKSLTLDGKNVDFLLALKDEDFLLSHGASPGISSMGSCC